MTRPVSGSKTRVRYEGERKQAIDMGRNRLVVAGTAFAVVFLAIAVRLVDVTLVEQGGEPQAVRKTTVAHATGRANIVDREGALLASSLRTASLYANPRVMLDPKDAAAKLAKVLPGLDRATTEDLLSSDRAFVWIRRHLTPREQYDVNRLGIPGIDFQQERRRIYPMGSLASHVVGFTDIDGKGLAGIERSYDEALRIRRTPLKLTVDVRVQSILEYELAVSMKKFSAIGAAGLVLDANTGEVIAMASLPTYDPNKPKAIHEDSLFNRNTLGVYEMGSTFKIFNTAMALEEGTVKLSSGYDATHPIKIARHRIRDFHAKKRWLSVPEIFMYSSNIGSAKMALDVGGDRQKAFLARLGMLARSPIELPETAAPLAPRRWREINTMTISFGHGISVSPIHLATGVAAVVNGGVLYPPTLIAKSGRERAAGRRVLSPTTSAQMRRLMRLVVKNGTGRNGSAEGYVVGGKTGTAEKASGRGYKRKKLLSSFVAAFPIHRPRFVILAMMDEAKGTKETYGYATGGWVAAPVVKKVIERMAPLYGIAPVDEDAPAIHRALDVKIVSRGPGRKRLASF